MAQKQNCCVSDMGQMIPQIISTTTTKTKTKKYSYFFVILVFFLGEYDSSIQNFMFEKNFTEKC